MEPQCTVYQPCWEACHTLVPVNIFVQVLVGQVEGANGSGEIAFILHACRYEEEIKFILLMNSHKVSKNNIHCYNLATTWWIYHHVLEKVVVESLILLKNFFGEGELKQASEHNKPLNVFLRNILWHGSGILVYLNVFRVSHFCQSSLLDPSLAGILDPS